MNMPTIVVNRPEMLPWDQGGVPVNAQIGGYVMTGRDKPLRKLPDRKRRSVSPFEERRNKGW